MIIHREYCHNCKHYIEGVNCETTIQICIDKSIIDTDGEQIITEATVLSCLKKINSTIVPI